MDNNASASKALVRKRDDVELMPPPPPPPKRIKRPKKILDEDSYTDALSRIIARDFFPGLLESETQQEYLDAIESKDAAWISSASRRLRQVMTPARRKTGRGTSLTPSAQTPRGFTGDTPISVSTEAPAPSPEEREEVDTNMSLGAFQSRYTSEDNESFYKLLDKQNSKRARKYAWLWAGNKLPSKMQLKQKQIEAKLMETRSLTDDGFERDRLAIRDREEKPAQAETWKSMPKNSLMYVPEGIEDAMETVIQQAEAESRAGPKAVSYENTRLPGPQLDHDAAVAPSPSLSAVRDAIAGKRGGGDLDSTTAGSETPRVNGYAFVDDEEPEDTQPPAPKIDLGPGEATPNPFTIKEQSKREALHHRMVDRISQSRRTSSQIGMTGKVDKTPVPKFPSSHRVRGGLTPAAQRLWSQIGVNGNSTPRTPFGQNTSSIGGRSSKLRPTLK
ncbi:nuclear protein DGCR14 [Durotheca rogersii]|uniref:nuclear protein DGCR14 n=1 Tax=Durotheca rogersii TaxID=419775 RepID=UPI00221FE2D2|nr:nuclear protein DGCR14 [Durotheca rogersii]KAI5862859.1 nuclear protein DGCR14 [Durotheca rogersii]